MNRPTVTVPTFPSFTSNVEATTLPATVMVLSPNFAAVPSFPAKLILADRMLPLLFRAGLLGAPEGAEYWCAPSGDPDDFRRLPGESLAEWKSEVGRAALFWNVWALATRG